MYQPEVTILIPVKNVAKFIRGCLDALLAQTYPKNKYKIWILDNNSDDGTPEIVAEYRDRGVEIFQLGIDPPAKKYNLVWPKIATEVIGLVDGDAYVSPDWLEKVIAPLAEPDVAGASGVIKTANPEKLVARLVGYDWQHRSERSTKNVKRVQSMHTVYKKKVIDEVGGFNEKLKTGYDVELGYKINRLGYKIRFVPEAVTYHCHRDNLKSFWKQQYEYGKFAIMRYFIVPENIKGDSFAPWWIMIQPLFYLLAIVAIFLSIFRFWPWWSFSVPLIILYLFYIAQSIYLAFKYKKTDALLLFPIYFIRPIACSLGGLLGLTCLVKKNK